MCACVLVCVGVLVCWCDGVGVRLRVCVFACLCDGVRVCVCACVLAFCCVVAC